MALARAQTGRGAHLMPLSIRELADGDRQAVREFNGRLEKAGIGFAFPETSAGLMQGDSEAESPFQTAFVISDGSAVRGGYILKSEQLFAQGTFFGVGNYQLPLSEGIIDRKYAI